MLGRGCSVNIGRRSLLPSSNTCVFCTADLQYKNVRPDYLNAIWGVINWGDAARRFDDASKPVA